MRLILCWMIMVAFSSTGLCQVDTSYIYNTSTPYGTLDIRIAKSSSRYYYLQPGKTISYRESSPGVKTNSYRDMTAWDSKPYTEGNLREKNGTSDYFIMNYRLLLPVNYNASYSQGYPIIIMMHGAGERGNCWDTKCYHATRSWSYSVNDPPAPTASDHQLLNNDHNLLHGGKQHLDAVNLAGGKLPGDATLSSKAFPGFVMFPQNINGWNASTVQDVIRLVRLMIKKYKIDPNRVYIHGLSNGGVGVYEAIKRAPWLFACALPMSAPSDGGITSANMMTKIASVPLWIFQGALDTAPTPARTEGYIKKFRDAGLNVRYTKYSNLGHGTWNSAYKEPDFFSWILSNNKSKIQAFAYVPAICKTTGQGVKLSVAEGFFAYQWERNGVIISGASSASYVATTTGTYRARFSRVRNPSSTQWNAWSPSMNVTEVNPAQPRIDQIGTVLLKDLNGSNTARLKAPDNYAHYYWYKNGSKLSLADTVKRPVINAGTCTSGCTNNGTYTLVVSNYDNCPSPASSGKGVYFSDQAPINITAPTNFTGSAASSSSIKLNWSDVSSGEVGFEIWRRKVTGSGTYSTWSMPVITSANATTVTDTGLEPNSTYQYKIRAAGNSGRSNYTPSSSTSYLVVSTSLDNIAPASPSGLTASQTGVGAITLKWTAATDNTGIREYVIYYGTTTVATGSNATQFVLKNLPVNRTFTFTVKAKDLGGNIGGASNSATANTYVEGLYYEHSTGAWANLDAINWNVAEFTGKVTSFSLSPRTQEDFFNFKYDGYVYIKTAGTYYFSTSSSDGSRVELDGVVVVNNDGIHSDRTIYGTAFNLTAGPKRIIVKFFEYDAAQNLSVRYKGPDSGNAWQNIPTTLLRSSAPTTAASAEEAEIVEIQSEENINVFPNPASPTNINVRVADAEEGNVNISMLDLNGRPLYQGNFMHGDVRNGVQIGTSQRIPDGLYLIVIQENKRLFKKKVAIRN